MEEVTEKKKKKRKTKPPCFRGIEAHDSIIIALDPGPEYTGIAVIDETYKVLTCGKYANSHVRQLLLGKIYPGKTLIQEMLTPYPGAGSSVSDTCVWLGRFEECFLQKYQPSVQPYRVLRASVRAYILPKKKELVNYPELLAKGSTPDKPKLISADAAVRYMLIKRWKERYNTDLEKTNQLSKDAWQALAVAVFWMDKMKEKFPK